MRSRRRRGKSRFLSAEPAFENVGNVEAGIFVWPRIRSEELDSTVVCEAENDGWP